MDLGSPLPLWGAGPCLSPCTGAKATHSILLPSCFTAFLCVCASSLAPWPSHHNDNTHHKLATASAHRLQHCFSLSLPGYFCHEIPGKEKKFLLLYVHLLPSTVREAGLGQLHRSAVLSSPGYQGRRQSGDTSLQHQLGTGSHWYCGTCWVSQLCHPK